MARTVRKWEENTVGFGMTGFRFTLHHLMMGASIEMAEQMLEQAAVALNHIGVELADEKTRWMTNVDEWWWSGRMISAQNTTNTTSKGWMHVYVGKCGGATWMH